MSSVDLQGSSNLTGGRLLIKNTGWNLLGQGAPLLLALVAIPVLIAEMGVDRLGILTLGWVVIGYFSLFDLGLSRALTKLTADNLGAGSHDRIPRLIWTALLMMLVLGLVGGVIVALLSRWFVFRILNIPEWLKVEALHAFYLLACSIPIVITTAGLRGIMEAYQRFGLVNVARSVMGIFTFAGPLFILLLRRQTRKTG